MKKVYTVLTMGNFDGLHLGHQKLLKEVVKRAESNGGKSLVLTYCKHPLETLNQITYPYLLTEVKRKEKLLYKLGIDQVEYVNFNRKIANLSAVEFLRKFIVEKFQADEIVFGYDTHFGKKRSGDFHLLQNYEEEFGYKSDLIKPFKVNNTIISSTKIRNLIREGNLEKANEYLGKKYSVDGEVIHGIKLGRKLGFPTINVKPVHKFKLLPKSGVYLTKILHNNKTHFAVTNVGFSPTVKDIVNKEVEAHILNFNDEIYAEKVRVYFLEKIRDEIKFQSKQELITAIDNDVRVCKEKTKSYEIRNN